MFLQYYLSEGHTQNVLIDTILEKLYYLPRELNAVETVVQGYTDYQLGEYLPLSMENRRSQWLEFLEVELNFDHLEDVFRLAAHSLADFLMFRVSCQEDLKRMVFELHSRRDKGTFSLRQVYLVLEFDFQWQDLPEDPSGFVALVSAVDVARQRCISLTNFKAGQQIIIQSQESNLFYAGRLYVDASGYIKSHAGSRSRRFPVREYASQVKALVADEELTRNWWITKDQVEGCKACEYRNICIDPDPLRHQADGSIRRSSPCAYDPFSGKWDPQVQSRRDSEVGPETEPF